MGRNYDLTGVEETQWIKTVGQHIVKVIGVTQGKTSNNNDVEKVTFQNANKEQIKDEFVVTENSLWKMKAFTKALKLGDVVNTDQWIGKFVVITTGKEGFTKENGEKGEKIVVKFYEPYEHKKQQEPEPLPEFDINDDELPFGN